MTNIFIDEEIILLHFSINFCSRAIVSPIFMYIQERCIFISIIMNSKEWSDDRFHIKNIYWWVISNKFLFWFIVVIILLHKTLTIKLYEETYLFFKISIESGNWYKIWIFIDEIKMAGKDECYIGTILFVVKRGTIFVSVMFTEES